MENFTITLTFAIMYVNIYYLQALLLIIGLIYFLIRDFNTFLIMSKNLSHEITMITEQKANLLLATCSSSFREQKKKINLR